MRKRKTRWRQLQENFVDHPYLLSTLRRMHTTLQSRRLWLTFFAILAIFILTGPFGTSETMSFADRVLYWTIVQAGAWILAITFSTLASDILAGSINNMLARMMIGSVAAAMPIGLLLAVTNHVFFGKDLDFASVSGSAISALPLCVIFCLLSYLAVCQSLPAAEEPADAGENEGKSDVPLLNACRRRSAVHCCGFLSRIITPKSSRPAGVSSCFYALPMPCGKSVLRRACRSTAPTGLQMRAWCRFQENRGACAW